MTTPSRRSVLVVLFTLAAGTALAFSPAPNNSHARPPDARRHAARKHSHGVVTYRTIDNGVPAGARTLRVVGVGTWSGAAPRSISAVATAFLQAVTGVPYKAIARGGRYVTRYDIAADATESGLIVVHFKAKGLGTACFSFKKTFGVYVPGSPWVPSTLAFTALGGTATAARLHAKGVLVQTGLAGLPVEVFHGTTSFTASMGAARPLSKTCKAVARL